MLSRLDYDAYMMRIETPRLRLRRWIDDDFEPLAAMCGDPRVMEFFPSIFSREETKAMWTRIQEHHARYGFGPWAMEVEGEFAGALGLNWILRFEAHFTDASRSATGCGLNSGVEALQRKPGRRRCDTALNAWGFRKSSLLPYPSIRQPAASSSSTASFSRRSSMSACAQGHPMRRQVLYRISRSAWEARPADRQESMRVVTDP